MKFEDLAKVADSLEKDKIKNKEYVGVSERVKGFRILFPEGSITTELVSLNGEPGKRTAVMKATVSNECGDVLSTGYAYEDAANGMVNKTSFVENCETSAVGRALGFLGLDMASIASAEEVSNALEIQAARSPISEVKQKALKAHLEECGVKLEDVLTLYKVASISEITERMHENIINHISDIKEAVK